MTDQDKTHQMKRKIMLALQGGGSHGAIGWGALDALLDEPKLEITAISGTSAGAMNAAVLAAGWAAGGPGRAREALAAYWRAVSRSGMMSPLRRTPFSRWTGSWSLDDSPAYQWFDLMSRLVSPYQMTPGDLHPLRSILAEHVDFAALNSDAAPRVYITATNVRTGLPRVFSQPNLTAEGLLASAALPSMFKAVEIDGEAYWDGGYVGNPALFPLIRSRRACDLILIQTNPFSRPDVPTTSRDINNRLNEITFNSALLKELRAAMMARRAMPDVPDIRLHRVHADDELAQFSPSSKLNVEWAYLSHLHDRGLAHGEAFLRRHGADIGQRATFDPSPMLEGIMDGPMDMEEVAG
ncbi:patatin-like phospholipase family protein [Aestuariibius sp. 2305UL40-4]|uniref:patatin-like phospholipase family protein n=1 Tax=Aestuariibius violaceus TaxID=3234132 RepID=UPI00345E7EAA